MGIASGTLCVAGELPVKKTELIRRRGPWRGLDDVELATVEWVDWHNNRRLLSVCDDLTRVGYEQVFYGSHPVQKRVEVSTP